MVLLFYIVNLFMCIFALCRAFCGVHPDFVYFPTVHHVQPCEND